MEYSLRDHLGNNRVMISDLNGDGYIQLSASDWVGNIPYIAPEIIQEEQYYPFGMAMEGTKYEPYWAKKDAYGFNGKELNTDIGLGWTDYGARWYDASIGRWNGVDLLAEMFPDRSAYEYGRNNPVLMVDPTGMASSYNWETQRYEDEDGNEVSWDDVQKEYGISGSNTNEPTPRERFDKLIDKSDYHGAVGAIIEGYGMNDAISNDFTLDIDKNVGVGILTTGGEIGGKQTIKINPKTLIQVSHGSISWEFLVTAIFHEMIHVYQRQTLKMTDHNEREFQAYYFSVTGLTFRLSDDGRFKEESIISGIRYGIMMSVPLSAYKEKIKGYYNSMSLSKQKEYEKFYQGLFLQDKP